MSEASERPGIIQCVRHLHPAMCDAADPAWAEVARLRAALKLLEWNSYPHGLDCDGLALCHGCGKHRQEGHASGCHVDAVLRGES